MSIARSFVFAVGDYLTADGEGGELHVVHSADGLLAVTARAAVHSLTLLMEPDEATTAGCHICTMAHYLRMAA